ncbi:MAG: UDP-N-acetyl-D-glucosamine dehydrogenase [Acidobacteria bacterium]|nr:MAG: UDP-N-acetyl-D-glucosamine dehydrogenase [Acidobacteriota bacterium]
MIKDELINLIRDKRARVGVIGLGYVGLPLATEFASKAFNAMGFEVDANKVEQINSGKSYIGDVAPESIKEAVDAGRLKATTDFDHLKDCDVIIICVPTPLRKTKEPDVSFILAAAEEIRKRLRRGQLIILESTTYPGTTDEVLLPMFEGTGQKLDEDFLLAFSPERVDPGNPQFKTHNIPKVVGGVTDDSTAAAAALYSQIVNDVHAVTSARVAEAAKLLENTFRAVNIGMANEMARLCYALGIDTWEVIRAAATKPFGFMPFYPGPGIGGHCIPLDPHYLSWKARQHGFDSRFIGLAEEVNSRMPEHVVQLVAELSIIDRLREKGCEVHYHDPFVREVSFNDSHTEGSGEPLSSVELTDDEIKSADCIVIVTDHSQIDYGRVTELAPLVVDTRNALNGDVRSKSAARIIRL